MGEALLFIVPVLIGIGGTVLLVIGLSASLDKVLRLYSQRRTNRS